MGNKIFIDIKYRIGQFIWIIKFNSLTNKYFVVNHSFEILGIKYENYKNVIKRILYMLYGDIEVNQDDCFQSREFAQSKCYLLNSMGKGTDK